MCFLPKTPHGQRNCPGLSEPEVLLTEPAPAYPAEMITEKVKLNLQQTYFCQTETAEH